MPKTIRYINLVNEPADDRIVQIRSMPQMAPLAEIQIPEPVDDDDALYYGENQYLHMTSIDRDDVEFVAL